MGQKYESKLKTDNGDKDDEINTSALMKDLIGTSELQKAIEQTTRLSMPAINTSALMKDLIGKSGLQKAIEQTARLSMPAMQTSVLMKDLIGTSELQKKIEQTARLSMPAMQTSALMKDLIGKSGLQKAIEQTPRLSMPAMQTSSLVKEILGNRRSQNPINQLGGVTIDGKSLVGQVDWKIDNLFKSVKEIKDEFEILKSNIKQIAHLTENIAIQRIDIPIDKCIENYIKENNIIDQKEMQEDRDIQDLKVVLQNNYELNEQMIEIINVLHNLEKQVGDGNKPSIKKYSFMFFIILLIQSIMSNVFSAIGDEMIQEPTKAIIRHIKTYVKEQMKEQSGNENSAEKLNLIIKGKCSIRNGHRLKAKTISNIYFGEAVIKVDKYRRWSQIVFFNQYGEQETGWVQSCYLEKVQKRNKR